MNPVAASPRRPPAARAGRFVSIGTKLALAILALIVAVSTLIYFTLTSHERESLLQAKENAARMTVALFAESLTASVEFDDAGGVGDALKHLSANGEVLYASVWRADALDASRNADRLGEFRRPVHTLDEPAPPAHLELRLTRHEDRLVASQGVKNADGARLAQSVVVFSLAKENEAYAASKEHTLLAAGGLALALTLILVLLTRATVGRPLGRLLRSVRALERGEHVAIAAGANDEVGRLAGAFGVMADAIAARNREIQARNADMRLVLNNVGQGFVALDPQGRLAAERSAVIDRWFGAPEADDVFWTYLGRLVPRVGVWFELGWTSLYDGFMPVELCLEQLPRRMQHGDRHYDFEYRPVGADPDAPPDKVIVVISDVTAVVEAEQVEQKQREMLSIFTRVMTDRSAFCDFYAESSRIVARVEAGQWDDPRQLFRDVHTLKGNCGIFGVESVASLCHGLETKLAEGATELAPSEVAELVARWADLTERIAVFRSGDADVVEVDEAELEAVIGAIERRVAHEHVARILRGWRNESVHKRLLRFGEAAEGLAARLGKGALRVDVDGGGLRVPRELWAPFWSGFTHVVRNCVDHGLEAPDERAETGKPTVPTLVLHAHEHAGFVHVEVSDDGRGVNWPKVAEKARAAGLPTERPEDLVEALFSDGVSTASGVTAVSGRGVGLAAVRQAVRDMGGEVTLRTEPGRGTTFTFTFPDHAVGVAPSALRLAA